MNNVTLPGFSTRVLLRMPRFVHLSGPRRPQQSRRTAIHFATLSGSLIAFVLLWCVMSTQANAASTNTLADNSGSMSEVDQPGGVVPLPQPLGEGDALFGAVPGVPYASQSNARRLTLADGLEDDPSTRPTWPLALGLGLALSLAVGVAVALVGASLSRSAMRRVLGKQQQIADQWARQYEAAQVRERRANAAAWDHPNAAVVPEPVGLADTARFYVDGPLSAMANLLDTLNALDVVNTPSRCLPQLTTLQYAMRTWSQTLKDLLDNSPLESRTLGIDESVTNLRELVNAVVALLEPSAADQGLRVSARVDPAVAETILADRARLGQLCFHLLSRAIQLSKREEVVLVVRTEPLHSGSQQQILISLTEVGEKNVLAGRQLRRDGTRRRLGAAGRPSACLPLCRALAQRMQGGLLITRGLDAAARVSVNVPFAVVQMRPPSPPTPGDAGEQGDERADVAAGDKQGPESPIASSSRDDAIKSCYEPFDQRFLDSLSDEGLDLSVFLDGWHRAMNDDIARLGVLRCQSDPDHLGTVLHRLSGAVGLVGARTLMEALQRASASPLEQSTVSIDSLIERTRRLVMQLEARPVADGST